MRTPARSLIVVVAIVAGTLSSSAVAAGTTAKAVAQVRTTHSVVVGSLTRSWLQIAPKAANASALPIIVVLSGSGATLAQEIARDSLVPYVTSDRAVLIYPTPIHKSWNASDGCCGVAGAQAIDDTGFLKQLVATVDPGNRRQIDYVGFSNGGRLGYLVACEEPGLFDAMAIVLAVPMPGCDIDDPFSVLQVDGTDDSYIPYTYAQHGHESPPATTEAAALREIDSCTAPPAVQTRGALILETWNGCANASRFAFATYVGGKHLWPTGSTKTPSGAAVIWSFFTRTALR